LGREQDALKAGSLYTPPLPGIHWDLKSMSKLEIWGA